jgi:hypothetical protein
MKFTSANAPHGSDFAGFAPMPVHHDRKFTVITRNRMTDVAISIDQTAKQKVEAETGAHLRIDDSQSAAKIRNVSGNVADNPVVS